MTVIELRMFCESLADNTGNLRGRPSQKATMKPIKEHDMPSKRTFALECDIPLGHLNGILQGKKKFNEAISSKVLPVMHKYGFQGS
jgi:hypothetical protein